MNRTQEFEPRVHRHKVDAVYPDNPPWRTGALSPVDACGRVWIAHARIMPESCGSCAGLWRTRFSIAPAHTARLV